MMKLFSSILLILSVHGHDTECEDNIKGVHINNIQPNVIDAEYAVRGPILLRALELEKELKSFPEKFEFDQIVKCNIGNPQSLGQKPISFIRQVLSLVMNPDLKDIGNFPKDVVERADKYLGAIRSIGAYSESQGVQIVREEVAEFITNRDGYQAKKENIFLTSGASEGVRRVLTLLLRDSNDAILIPIPQYPLYSALTQVFGGHMAGYYLNEDGGWDTNMKEIIKAYNEAKKQGKNVRALVVINPGNPTGSTLPESSMIDIVNFCKENNLVLMADEVYQTNIYRNDRPFISFRKVVHDLKLDSSGLQVISFHSVSKGMIGECGLRGGYCEFIGFDQLILDQVYKLASIELCSNLPGQLAIGLMVNPPKENSPSYELYSKETNDIYQSLKRRAQKLEKMLNDLPGVKCNPIEGAMYAFPQITLPIKYVEKHGEKADVAYALELLENTGLVVVPGSGFGQLPNTLHFRTTFLPPEDVMDNVLERLKKFQIQFIERNQ